ncbi:MAG: 30S ribosome-binding factor RbfA [Schwartzia sp.]|nr:30S ribosome-binding factor RbfA [Schwartzia sp. (in: firmicutes)]MBR5163022.1 30S ribosome-binding factor RbfA [Schwartzia sp. (in: firmicutes)]
MGQLRMERVQELMKQEISKIILEDVKDPRIGFVTVTRVHVTNDLRSARVFVSLLGSDEQMADCWRGLNRSLGFIRREVGRRVRLRYTPELSLEIDDSMAYSAHIQELLLGIQREESEKTEKGGTDE